jgi:hypothetical protein
MFAHNDPAFVPDSNFAMITVTFVLLNRLNITSGLFLLNKSASRMILRQNLL